MSKYDPFRPALFPTDDAPYQSEFRIGGQTWKTTQVFETYWRFASERQKIFFARIAGESSATKDPILQTFKFTNAYRASDRVSQYLIRNVIYDREHSPEDVFFRIMLFKMFNKIETWELLQSRLGHISSAAPRYEEISKILTEALARGERIYSAAYIMPSGGGHYARKHDAHLFLLGRLLNEHVPRKIAKLKGMNEAFELLKSFPMLGDFLAYQFVTDINYSTLCDFSETEFVVAGPGARDGIRKCFPDLPMSLAGEAIKAVCLGQIVEFTKRDIEFQTLWGRRLQLIDCQNLFCEVDKYSRVAHPEIVGLSARTRIKQTFRASGAIPAPFYPPKWQLKHS